MSHYIRDRKQGNRMEKSSIWAVGSVVALSGLALAVAHRFTIEAHASMPTPFALDTALDRAEVTLADGRALSLHDGALSLAGKQIALSSPRRFASLTVMPTGQVLVWGGIDDEGRLIDTGEWFEPSTGALVTTGRLGLPPRAGHTLNVMSDGTLAMTGGWGVGNVPAHDVALWRPLDRHLDLLPGDGAHVRLKSEASLLADGTLQVTGGVDEIGRPVHDSWRFGRADAATVFKPHGVVASYPTRDNGGASPIGPLALRFSEPVDVAQLGGTVSLLGPNGVVKTRVVGAEDGRLAFVQLPDELYPAARYTIFVQGLRTAKGDAVPYEAIGFTTKAARSGVVLAGEGQRPGTKAPESSEPPVFVMAGAGKAVPCKPADAFHLCRDKGQVKDGAFYPGQDNVATSSGGHWRLYKDRQTLPDTKQLEANLPKGSTALIGQVRRIDESPVANVEISVDGQKVRTDGQGVFVLQHLLAGRRELFVDGRPAGSANTEYGRFIVGADVTASTVNHMPFVMYLPRVLERDKIALPSPTTRETVLTHPDMPGLELRIPAGAVFKDRDGKVLNEIAIVPTPVDHAPFPLPDNFPMYFTIQPGDAVVQGMTPEAAKGIQVVYPNYGKQKPADKADFWVYSAEKGWEMYGAGHVSADASQLVADKDTRLVWALGAGASQNEDQPDADMPPCNKSGGDPVDLQTGRFFRQNVDLEVSDTIPIAIDRTVNGLYSPSSPFGLGAGTSFAMTLSGKDFQRPKLVLACGEPISFDLVAGSAVWPLVGTVWAHRASNSAFYGATLQFLNDSTPEGAHWVVTLRDGTQYWFDRHAPNKLYQQVDRSGNRVRYLYTSGLLTEIVSPNGRTIDLAYNNKNLVDHVSDQSGRYVQYRYHQTEGPTNAQAGYVLDQVTYADGTSEQYSYRKIHNGDVVMESWYVASLRDRNGVIQVSNTFDLNGRISRQDYADGSYATFAYELSNGRVAATILTDPAGVPSRTEFDPVSKYPSRYVRAVGTGREQVTSYVRSAAGLLLSVTDNLGHKTAYSYDDVGNRLAITRAAGTDSAQTERFEYTSDNQVAKVIDAEGVTTRFSYEDGCLSSVAKPSGVLVSALCDSQGRPVEMTDGAGRSTRYEYSGGDLTRVLSPSGASTTFVYDVTGRAIAVTTPNGGTELTSYDSNDRVVSKTSRLGGVTEFTYDANGALTERKLPNGSYVRYSYDARGRLVSRVDQQGLGDKRTYDLSGRIVTYEDRMHRVTAFSFDELGRLALTSYADGSGVGVEYDAIGQPVRISDTSSGEISWAYDSLGRVIKETSNAGDVTYTYDSAGRRTAVNDPSGRSTLYSYDDDGRLQSVSLDGNEAHFAYDASGYRSQLDLPNGVRGIYAYDGDGRISKISYSGTDNAVLAAITYSYDSSGRRTADTRTLGQKSVLSGPTSADAEFDSTNRLIQDGEGIYQYDANGNLLSDGRKTYDWDARNRLVNVKQAGISLLSLKYDALGRKTSKSWADGSVASYVYDGQRVISRDMGGELTAFMDGASIDEHLMSVGASKTYYLIDALKSTIGLTDDSGSLRQSFSYGQFGETDAATNHSEFLFAGREMDLLGMYDYRARYYSPDLHRFLNEDPMGIAGGDANFYAYVGNDPINFTDPFGYMRLPSNPGDLPDDWLRDSTHRDPNGERYRDPSGNSLDFHRGRPGLPGWRGKDHWHYNGCDDHLQAGDEVPDAVPAESRGWWENSPSVSPGSAPSPATITAAGILTIIIIIVLAPVGA
ncbi:MAG: RHS repeat-associated core domain-containing protein [Luteibacter sp.]|uniref:RHS repeat-associated core domain-containing protein n=1 Tax=Luteibacter sp. TaxID=1886636 RepID=UPI002806C379|nr:RHS repeat-associated core domain-containing protein [Luteibacter sp.]MDQ7997130.1 RHS repeat-associated core domain-containing protein [Luteibacter sp.]MDQ8049780.1 RHS repeat-associated core domain-containing protein [Luteibacter sp.]